MEVLINTTPHEIYYLNTSNEIIFTLEKCLNPARIVEKVEENGIIKHKKHYCIETKTTADIINLPEPENGVIYIVSKKVKEFCNHRLDLRVPSRINRINGKILGCYSFGI